MSKMFAVICCSGEWEDYNEKILFVTSDEQKAEDAKEELTAYEKQSLEINNARFQFIREWREEHPFLDQLPRKPTYVKLDSERETRTEHMKKIEKWKSEVKDYEKNLSIYHSQAEEAEQEFVSSLKVQKITGPYAKYYKLVGPYQYNIKYKILETECI